MIATFKPCRLHGTIDAPPSKSMAHRYLIAAALSGEKCTLEGIDYSEDILASIDCLRALGVNIIKEQSTVTIDPQGFMQVKTPVLNCRESGSTLRFLIPLALCLGQKATFYGSDRLLERPLDVYEMLCKDHGFLFHKDKNSLTLCGRLASGDFKLRGDISSQFITGLIFALVYLRKDSAIEIIPPFESRPYISLTLAALAAFGADVTFKSEYVIEIKASKMHAFSGRIEGDYSNAAFLDAFNMIGSSVKIGNLDPESLQGDRVYMDYFKQLENNAPTLDLANCPDLAPVLFALASLKNGATFINTARLKEKESDRGEAMHEELKKLGGGLLFFENSITVPKRALTNCHTVLDGHNDHRIVMALSLILSQLGGSISGCEAVRKSYPHFFEDIKRLGAEVEFLEENTKR